MRKIFKTMLFGGIGTVSVVAPLSVISFSVKQNTEADENKLLVFQNKEFQSKEDALKYFLSMQKDNINKHNVIGSLSGAIIDSKFNILNKNLLPDYDPSQLIFAYKASNGQLVQDINLARSSYARPQDSKLRYTFPGNPNPPYGTREEAEVGAQKYIQNQVMPSVTLRMPDTSEYHLNPSNKKDVESLKTELLKELTSKTTTNSKLLANIWGTDVDNDTQLANLTTHSNGDKGWGVSLVDANSNQLIDNGKTSFSNYLDFTKSSNVQALLEKCYDKSNSSIININNHKHDNMSNIKKTYNIKTKKLISTFDFENPDKHIFYMKNDSDSWWSTNSGIDWLNKDVDIKVNGKYAVHYRYDERRISAYNKLFYATTKNPQIVYTKSDGVKIAANNGGDTSWLPDFNNESIKKHFTFKLNDNNKINIDFSGSRLEVHQNTHEDVWYYHEDTAKKITNIKTTQNIEPSIATSDFKKARIYLASKKGNLKKILTYNGKPIFEMKNNNTLENVSQFKFNANKYTANKLTGETKTIKLAMDDTSRDIVEILKQNPYKEEESRIDLIKDQGKVNGGSWDEIYRQYIHSLSAFTSNCIVSSSNLPTILKPDDILFFDNKDVVFKNNLIYSANFNPSIWSKGNMNTLEGIRDIFDAGGIQQDKDTYAPTVSACWVFFDTFGSSVFKIDDAGEYNNAIFDDVDLMKQNIIDHEGMHIDSEKVFVKTKTGTILVKNQTNNIYSLKYDHQTKYFKDYESLKSYIIDLIDNNGYLVQR